MNGDGPEPPVGRPQIEEILDEQRARWDRGERPLVEDFLAQHPTLREDAEATVDVIYHDFVIRQALGESPSRERLPAPLPRMDRCARPSVRGGQGPVAG